MRKIFALLIAVLMTVSVFVSCSGKESGNVPTGQQTDGTDPASSAAESAAESNVEEDAIDAYVRELAEGVNFNGWTFTLIAKSDSGHAPVKEEETNITESDAVYFRQRDLEQYFGIDIEYENTENGDVTAEQVINEVTAGGDAYDLVQGATPTTGQALLNNSVIRQVDNLKYVDLDRDWWLASLRDVYSVSHRLFFLTGPIVKHNFCDASCMLFNKRVTAQFGIDDAELYQAVRDGKWTLDRMIGVASIIPENVSGTGVWRYCEPIGYSYIMTSGMQITRFDEEGNPYVEKQLPIGISDLADKLCPIFSDDSQTVNFKYKVDKSVEDKYGVDDLYDLFVDDRALFKFGYTGSAIDLRQFDVEFGILPVPKQTESQKDYCSYARMGWDSAVYIPRSVKSVDFSDVITEAMGALSEKYVKSAYYDKILKGQTIFDMESRDMIDIIFRTKVYDMIALFSGADFNFQGGFLQALEDGFNFDNSQLASQYASNAKVINTYAKQLVRAVARIDD